MSSLINPKIYNTRILLNRLVVSDINMPSLYINNNEYMNKKNIYSVEHIFPRCFLTKKDANDMHNTVRTHIFINKIRSNYAYRNHSYEDEDEWIELPYKNYVNHKKKLFIPNELSKGFISRSIMYMSYKYGYNFNKIISKEDLYKWNQEYPPKECEKYHNMMIKKYQDNDNIFISKYHKNNFRKNIRLLF